MESSKSTYNNISGLVSRFSHMCRFTSTEVHHPSKRDSHDLEDAAPAPLGSQTDAALSFSAKRSTCEYYDMLKLFELLSAFKVAYVLLQQAHIPYDPHKIEAADELAVRQLKALCKMKRLLKVNAFNTTTSTCSDSLLPKIRNKEAVLESLKIQANTKSYQIQSLRRELLELELENAELAERLYTTTNQVSQCIDFDKFQDIVNSAYISVHDFAKPLISLMKASGWDLDRAANSVQDSVLYHKRCHKKYAFEAYISRRMYSQGGIHQDNIAAALRANDPMEYLLEEPSSAFSEFCRTKYLLVVHPKLELSFFGNLDHRNLVSDGKHPRTQFYQAFAKMARWFWILQGAAESMTPKAVIYGVKRGTAFSDSMMEMVDEDLKELVESSHRQSSYKVSLMIMPGFRFGENFVKSLVYCSDQRS